MLGLHQVQEPTQALPVDVDVALHDLPLMSLSELQVETLVEWPKLEMNLLFDRTSSGVGVIQDNNSASQGQGIVGARHASPLQGRNFLRGVLMCKQ
jgi:hypothetical protein